MRKVRRLWQKCRKGFHKHCIQIFILFGVIDIYIYIEYRITEARSGIALLLEGVWKLKGIRKNVV